VPATEDLYEVLQVSPSAEPEVIEAAYRRLARKYHPDVSLVSGSPERMQRIVAAYEVLGDATRRAAYDATYARLAERRRGRGDWRTARWLGWLFVSVLVLLFVALPPLRVVLVRGLPVVVVVLLVVGVAWWAWQWLASDSSR
jgi:hypothetical protein